ncbi:MAG: site-2 protease family protein [Clostridia bacterium]|nr:site-2 protease family protein [Clostridia bacterium]
MSVYQAEYLLSILAGAIAVIFIFTPHEYAHALIAYKSGDMTAKLYGRLTLNPMKHLDPIGYVMCVLTGFGWAKPVPVNPDNFRHYRRGLFGTAVAGVVTNYIIAFIAYPLYLVMVKYVLTLDSVQASRVAYYLVWLVAEIFYLIYAYGMCVFLFNLLPFRPLDGFRIVEALTRGMNPVRRFLETYGYYILWFLIIESFVCRFIYNMFGITYIQYANVLGYVSWVAQNYIGWPIMKLWGLIIP